MTARNGNVISGNVGYMNFDTAVRTFASSFPEQGLHHFAFHREWFNTPSLLGRRRGVITRNSSASDRRKIMSAVQSVGGETDPIGIPRNKVSGLWDRIANVSDQIIDRNGAVVQASSFAESFEKQYGTDHQQELYLLSLNMSKNIAAHPNQAAAVLSNEARYLCAAFFYVQACFHLAEELIDFLDQRIGHPDLSEIFAHISTAKTILGDLDPEGQQSTLLDFEQRLGGLADIRREEIGLSGNSKAILWFGSGLVAASVAMAVFFFFAHQPSGMRIEEVAAGDLQQECVEETNAAPVAQEETISIPPAAAVQPVKTTGPANYVEKNINIPTVHDLAIHDVSERVIPPLVEGIEIPLLTGSNPYPQVTQLDKEEPLVTYTIESSVESGTSEHDEGLDAAPAETSISIFPDKKKRRIAEQRNHTAASSKEKIKTEESQRASTVRKATGEAEAGKDAVQLQATVHQPSSYSKPVQEIRPEQPPKLQSANVLASMDGQDAVLLNKAFELVPSLTHYAWDNGISRYTYEIVLQPAYTDLHGRICRSGSIMAWNEPQVTTAGYHQQKITGCRADHARWFVE